MLVHSVVIHLLHSWLVGMKHCTQLLYSASYKASYSSSSLTFWSGLLKNLTATNTAMNSFPPGKSDAQPIT